MTKITDAIDVSFNMPMVSLARPGITARIDCGRMMRRNVSNGPMPSAAAAVDCERFTDKMPARNSSALNAASFNAKPITAVVISSKRKPISGSASKMNTSCSSCGVPRTNQI